MKKTYMKPCSKECVIDYRDCMMKISFDPGDGSGGSIQTGGGVLGPDDGGLVRGRWPGVMNRDEWSLDQ